MWWVNGEATEQIPATDRGLAYGDGLFETMRVVESRIPLIPRHLERLNFGAEKLGLRLSVNEIESSIAQALDGVSQKEWQQSVIKLILTRSGDSRGYRPDQDAQANILTRATELKLPEQKSLLHSRICEYALPENSALAGIKHLNRLDQVIASRELDADEDEGLLLNENGVLIEGLSNNIFLVHGTEVSTPRISCAGVKGVMRDFIFEKMALVPNLKIQERDIRLSEIDSADELLLTNAVRGVRNLASVRGRWHSTQTSIGDQLREILRDHLARGFISY